MDDVAHDAAIDRRHERHTALGTAQCVDDSRLFRTVNACSFTARIAVSSPGASALTITFIGLLTHIFTYSVTCRTGRGLPKAAGMRILLYLLILLTPAATLGQTKPMPRDPAAAQKGTAVIKAASSPPGRIRTTWNR